MPTLSEIAPSERFRIIDLARAAGIDVSGWGDFRGGKERAASNPKYCYEGAFVEPGEVVLLCLWHRQMEMRDDAIVRTLNMRDLASQLSRLPGKSVWVKRAERMDSAIQAAVRDVLPVRVVVVDGPRRGVERLETEASRVKRRLLDPVVWGVTSYDLRTGDCTLTRGAGPGLFADQFSVPPAPAPEAGRRAFLGTAFARSPAVRRCVLRRAGGSCEWCAQPGFLMADGRVYLETHHIVALAEEGPDTEGNVVALCPNHHREAHHGANSSEMRRELLGKVQQRHGLPAVDHQRR